MKNLYNNILANEWIDWVETPNSEGTREQEMFPFIRNWLKEIKPKILVDIGCGQGDCSKLVDDEISYIGVDQSPILIERARKLHISSNKKFLEGDAYNIPLENNSVDVIVSIWVWSHLDNLESASDEMFRILKPQGRFLLITANPATYEERKTFYKNYEVKDNLLTGTFDLGNGKALTNTTLYLHSTDQIKKAIKLSGLNINYTDIMGQAESSDDGLYLVIEGYK